MAQGSVKVTVFGKTDLGRTRDHNEDTFLVADLTTPERQPPRRRCGTTWWERAGSLFMVADGMGGAAAGELASDMATEIDLHPPDDGVGRRHRGDGPAVRLPDERGASSWPTTGSTSTPASIPRCAAWGPPPRWPACSGTELYLAQVGDSRGYLVRDGQAIQITKDQSLMQRLVEAGELTEEEAEQSERRNIILQALGPDPRVKVDLTYQPLCRGDVLVLCSDGLSGQVKKEEIGEQLARTPDLVRPVRRS